MGYGGPGRHIVDGVVSLSKHVIQELFFCVFSFPASTSTNGIELGLREDTIGGRELETISKKKKRFP